MLTPEKRERAARRATELLEAKARELAAADGFDIEREPNGLFRALAAAMAAEGGRFFREAMVQAAREQEAD